MERASKAVRALPFAAESLSAEELVSAAWPGAVGKIIAAHTHARRMVRSRLIIDVEDATWQRQLFALTPHILKNLTRSIGPGLVDDLEFRIMPARRPPQRAAQEAAVSDEADQIADPVLRSIYRVSRLKAQA